MIDEAQIVFPKENGRKRKKTEKDGKRRHHLNLSEFLKN